MKSDFFLRSHAIAGSGGTTWDNSGDTGPDAGDSFSPLPFYTSGVNADFVTVNGAYQPVISMEVSFALYTHNPCSPMWFFTLHDKHHVHRCTKCNSLSVDRQHLAYAALGVSAGLHNRLYRCQFLGTHVTMPTAATQFCTMHESW